MRLLSGGPLHHDLVVAPEPTLVGEGLIGAPRLQDHSQRLLEACLCLLWPHAEASELRMPVALSDTEVKTSPGEKIEGRRTLGQQHRVMPWQHEHRRSHPYRRRACGDPTKEIQRRRNLPKAREVMLDQERGVEAEPVGFTLISTYSRKPRPGSPPAVRGASALPNKPKRIPSRPSTGPSSQRRADADLDAVASPTLAMFVRATSASSAFASRVMMCPSHRQASREPDRAVAAKRPDLEHPARAAACARAAPATGPLFADMGPPDSPAFSLAASTASRAVFSPIRRAAM